MTRPKPSETPMEKGKTGRLSTPGRPRKAPFARPHDTYVTGFKCTAQKIRSAGFVAGKSAPDISQSGIRKTFIIAWKSLRRFHRPGDEKSQSGQAEADDEKCPRQIRIVGVM